MTRTSRRVGGVFLIVVGVVFAVVGFVAAPVAADDHKDENPECNGAFQGSPDGSLAIAGTPAAGPVDDDVNSISVTATWDEGDWSGDELDKILNCVTVNGELVDDLSQIDKPTANDESQGFTINVSGLSVGDEVCARVRLSGTPTAQNPSTQKSNILCWTITNESSAPVYSYACAAPTVDGDDATLRGSTNDPNVNSASFTLTRTGGSPRTLAAGGSNSALVAAANDLENGQYAYTLTFTGPGLSKTSGECTFTVNVQSSSQNTVVDNTTTPAVVAGVQVTRETPAAVAAVAAAPATQGAALAATGLSPTLLALGLGLVGLGAILTLGATRTVRPAGQHYIS